MKNPAEAGFSFTHRALAAQQDRALRAGAAA
jgi:hypothetical protein